MRMIAVALVCLIGGASAGAEEGDAVGGSGFMPEDFESFTLILLLKGEAWSAESTPDSDRLQAAHLAHLEQMWVQGKAVVCGPFDDQDDDSLRGMCLYRTDSLDEARRLAEGDPAVQAGHLRVEALSWWIGKGHLAFPLAPTDEVRGTAYDAKGGAIIEQDDGRVVYLQGLDCWPDELSGGRVVAHGRLVNESYLPEATVAPNGAISQGTTPGSSQWVLKAASWEAAP
jgi:uncharacterized protein